MTKNGITPDTHEIYGRRKTRNIGVGVMLIVTVGMIFAVTIVKLSDGVNIQGYDHTFETTPGEGER